ncbi:MAG: TetR/AcrR family transcriptional regulator [Streptosporangiales bacterium]
MSRVVDHDKRRRDLGEAVRRVIVRDGVDGASVRTVAQEAGVSAGSLRHYFGTQAELLAFAMRQVDARVRARIARIDPEGAPAELVLRYCVEVLPLDDERRTEAEVWFAFTGAGLSDPALHQVRDETDAGMHELCSSLTWSLVHAGLLAGDRAEVEANRLWALLDGLALQLLLSPGRTTPDGALVVLRHHLADLLARPVPG